MSRHEKTTKLIEEAAAILAAQNPMTLRQWMMRSCKTASGSASSSTDTSPNLLTKAFEEVESRIDMRVLRRVCRR
jgi:hypothetical protein